jgi:hypothetical protein
MGEVGDVEDWFGRNLGHDGDLPAWMVSFPRPIRDGSIQSEANSETE